jgi:excisionase family DNA binding protein
VTAADILTIKEVAERLRLAERTVYAMVQHREIPAFKIRNQWRFRRDAFECWLEAVSAGGSTAQDATARFAEAEAAAVEQTPAAPAPAAPVEAGASSGTLPALTDRVSQVELHRRFIEALGAAVTRHSPLERKPLELDLAPPLPAEVRVYLFNATRPPGGRPTGEHKIQLIVPGQRRGERGSFDDRDGRTVILCGYVAEEDVFVLWDAGLYSNFAWSRNVQVKVETIIRATAGRVARQTRQLRRPDAEPALEHVLTATPPKLAEALAMRSDLTLQRLMDEG